METFSDGVIAIIITIMVLELRVPHDSSPAALIPLVPVFLSYVRYRLNDVVALHPPRRQLPSPACCSARQAVCP